MDNFDGSRWAIVPGKNYSLRSRLRSLLRYQTTMSLTDPSQLKITLIYSNDYVSIIIATNRLDYLLFGPGPCEYESIGSAMNWNQTNIKSSPR
jgi:hypothetical protein